MLDQNDGSTFEHHFDKHSQVMEYFIDFLSFIAFNRFKYLFFQYTAATS